MNSVSYEYRNMSAWRGGASIQPKGPKGTQRDPKGTQKDPKGTQKNSKLIFFIYDQSLSLTLKKKKNIKVGGHIVSFLNIFYNDSPQMLLYIHIYSMRQPYLVHRFLHFMKDII